MKTIVQDADVVGSNPVASTKTLSDSIVMRSDFLLPRKKPELVWVAPILSGHLLVISRLKTNAFYYQK